MSDERRGRVNLLERLRAEAPPPEAPSPAPTAAPRVDEASVEAPTSLDAPELAAEVAALRAERCGHGKPLAECAPCLMQLFLPRQFSLMVLVGGLYSAWPLRCDECAAPATHETPEDGSDLALCGAHAGAHRDAAAIPGAQHLDAVARLVARSAAG